ELTVGELSLRVLATPGHTPESICLVITDHEKSGLPWGVLTGDTLFLGDVGRPDLSKKYTPPQLAGMLYDSLHDHLLKLADDVLVYPAHGAGSLCGRNMRAERSSTIGTERLTNYALQVKSKEEFVTQLTSHLKAHPVLIAGSEQELSEARIRLARVGIEELDGHLSGGVAAWKEAGLSLSTIRQVTATGLSEQIGMRHLQVLDVRREPEWEAGHIENAVWWPLDNFKVSPPEIDRDTPIAVHCKGGYRSMIACCLLQRAGFHNVTNVAGG